MHRASSVSTTPGPGWIALLLVCATACAPLRPLDQVRLRPDVARLLEIDERVVHLEDRGEGEAVILLHGFGSSNYSWRKVLPRIAQHYRVLAPDLNGFGFSDRPEDDFSYTREGQVRLVLDMMDELGIDSAHFVGHSYGGGLTMALAHEHPERVRSMILIDSAPPDYPITRRKLFARSRLLTNLYVRGIALNHRFIHRALERSFSDDSKVTPQLVEAYADRLRIEGVHRAYRKLTIPRPRDPVPREIVYEQLDFPTLVVWGRDDDLVSVDKGLENARRLPRFRWVAIDGCGHSPIEECSEAFLDAALPFLQALSSGRDPGLTSRALEPSGDAGTTEH